jgi:cysteine desulfurase
LLEVDVDEIVFTSCGTESDNLAVLGSGPAAPATGHLVISAVEHPAVEEPARELARRGWTVDRLEVDASGRVALEAAATRLTRSVDVVSVISAQNETGAIQPVKELVRLARATNPRVVVHTDAAQAVGKVGVHPRALGVDLLTVVGHKMYAPKGIGALYVRSGVELRPRLFGGGQERGLRPGTESVPLIVALGAACALAASDLADESVRQIALREQLWSRLVARVPSLRRTGDPETTLPGTLHACFPDMDARELLARVPEVAASTGSACHTDVDGPAGVLTHMGIDPALARGAVRLSVGRGTSVEDVEEAARRLGEAAQAQLGR